MIAKTFEKRETFICCPNCGKEDAFSTKSLSGEVFRKWGPWICKDCLVAIRGETLPDGQFDIEQVDEKWGRALVLLKLPPTERNIYAVLRHTYVENLGNLDYMFEEHSCPTNFLRDIEVVIDGESTDPHGLFDFVGAIVDEGQWIDIMSGKELLELFKILPS